MQLFFLFLALLCAGGSAMEPAPTPAWEPYEASDPRLRNLFSLRWAFLRPLHTPLVSWLRFSIGELLIAVTFVGALVGALLIAAGPNPTAGGGCDDGGRRRLDGGDDNDAIEDTGGVAQAVLALTFATVNHNSVWTFLLGIPFERALTYHKLFAFSSVAAGAYHGYLSSVRAGGGGLAWCADGEWVTGFFLLVAMAALLLTSVPPIRRRLFNAFLYTHVLLFVTVVVLSLAHDAGGVLFGAGLYAADACWRYGYVALNKHPREVQLTCLPANVIRVSFPKRGSNFSYKAGQYLFLCVPALSLFEWHPFSVSSAPHEDLVTVHIRVLGNWTRKLQTMVGNAGGAMQARVLIEGCYGECGLDVEGPRYDTFLLVSGGIGITPMQSIANNLVHQHARGRPLHKLWFVWSVQGGEMAESMFEVGGEERGGDGGDGDARLPAHFTPDLLTAHRSSVGPFGSRVLPEHRSGVGPDAGHPYAAIDDPSEPLHCDFHLTRVRSLDGVPNLLNIRPDVQECLRFGRPDLPSIFRRLRAIAAVDRASSATDKHCVAVLVCGPRSMLSEVRRLCWSESGGGVNFDYHGETFAF